MIGKLDKEIIEKFKEFQEKTGKHRDLCIEDVEFEKVLLKDIHIKEKIETRKNTSANKFIEIGDIDRVSKKYDISNKIKHNLPEKGKHAPKGTILVSRVRPLLGGYTIIDGDDYTFTSGDLNPIVLPDSVSVDYVFKIICSQKFEIFLKKNQNVSGQKPTITSKLYDFDIPIPKDLNKFYSSYQIQEAIVEFLEFWKEGYTDLVRENTNKKISIYKTIKKLIVKNTFQYDEFLVDNFDKFAKEKGYDIPLQKIEFVEYHFFKKNNKNLFLPKKLEKNQQLILENSVEDGVPVYSGGKEKLCDVDKNRYLNKIFIPNENNPDISFANNGDGSAGRNFFIHTKPYFVNQERTVISFKNDDEHDSLYVYYLIQDMRDKYNMNRENRPTPKDLPKFGIKIQKPLPVNEFSSKDIQYLLVEFWQTIINQIDKNLSTHNRMFELTDIIDRAFLYRAFSKIEWSKNE